METIVRILHEIRPEFDFSSSENFIEEGMLDSFDLMTLVSDLDRTYAISIQGVDILPENFCSLPAIRGLLQRYGVEP